MTFTFNDSNTFRNVGIGTLNNKVIIMNVSKSTDNLSFHSTTNDNNIDILSIKTILNKDPNNDLHICTYNENVINPIIKINNTNNNCNITSNLNIGGNLNVSGASTFTGISTFNNVNVLGTFTTQNTWEDSDDRLKMNEILITGVDAKNIIMKLRPQTYDKYSKINSDNKTTNLTSTKRLEAGLIAQEIYYEVPELRFIVSGAPTNETNTDDINISDSNIQTDPDYSNWGSETAGVSYTQLIPYLIAHNKIQQDEINNLQTKVSTLETQLNTYKNIIDKLTTSNSFEEFKNSL